MPLLKILALGDVVGPEAVNYIGKNLRGFQDKNGISFTVINGENACVGNGLDIPSAKQLISAGADVITSGNHIWHKKEIRDYLDNNDRILRPANYRATVPGAGYTFTKCEGYTFLVMNVMGVSYMDPLDNPFTTVDKILEKYEGKYDYSVLDIHAEATGEKYALARYFDGRINIIFGTHTHVPTSDNQVLKRGSGFVCDLGMCGPEDSVLGMVSEIVIEKLITNIPQKFEIAGGKISCMGVIFTLDTDSGKITKTERITF